MRHIVAKDLSTLGNRIVVQKENDFSQYLENLYNLENNSK